MLILHGWPFIFLEVQSPASVLVPEIQQGCSINCNSNPSYSLNNNLRRHPTVPAVPLPDVPALNIPQLPDEPSNGEYEEIQEYLIIIDDKHLKHHQSSDPDSTCIDN